ncbi:isoform 1 of sister chromatid cohesion 1 protein 1 [Fagus crenata]
MCANLQVILINADEFQYQHPDHQVLQQSLEGLGQLSLEGMEPRQDQETPVLNPDWNIASNNTYSKWLVDASTLKRKPIYKEGIHIRRRAVIRSELELFCKPLLDHLKLLKKRTQPRRKQKTKKSAQPLPDGSGSASGLAPSPLLQHETHRSPSPPLPPAEPQSRPLQDGSGSASELAPSPLLQVETHRSPSPPLPPGEPQSTPLQDEVRSIPTASGHDGLSHNSDDGLEPIAENGVTDPGSASGLAPSPLLQEETQRSPTPLLPLDEPQSLWNLARDLNRNKASRLFSKTLVLASANILKAEQTLPYGDILISRTEDITFEQRNG